MLRRFQNALAALVLSGSLGSVHAFSLLGPFDTWQVSAIGYQLGGDIGGPMNLGEEYRWNVRTNFFGFDESFLNYFGSQGTAAVLAAVKILNDLPPVSQMSLNLTEFPTDALRENFQAGALNLLDLKSTALGLLLEEMGLASPERFTWTLRDRQILGTPPVTNYLVIQRNFDPVTLAPSRFVNGTLYSYLIVDPIIPGVADALEVVVPNPPTFAFTSVAGFNAGPGQFWIGLTRDDVGGLRYLYRTNNANVEPLASGAILTPTVVTNPPPPGSPVGTPSAVVTNMPVNQALRQGLDKMVFQLVQFDSLLGFFVAFTNQYTDAFITNSAILTQTVLRSNAGPDIIFTAEDLGTVSTFPVIARRTTAAAPAWLNNNLINGQATLAGPGIIQPQVVITFNKVGPSFGNNTFFLDEAGNFPNFVWGSFDGSTNLPVVYPIGSSIFDLEFQVLSGP